MCMKLLIRSLLLAVTAGIFFVGCASDQPQASRPQYVDPTTQGTVAGTGIESQDMIAATDKMVRKILETPKLQSLKTSPVIALIPVENRSRFPIDKEIFTARMKALLNEKAEGKIIFVARDRMDAIKKEKDLKSTGEVTGVDRRKMYGADYFLTGELSGMSTSSTQGKSDYLLFTFRLIDTETSEEIWEGYHELKKEGSEDVIYR
jgi:PBP1b-binding outer membrane lipoprotein LpoB